MFRNRVFNFIFIVACAVPLSGMLVYTQTESAGNESAAAWPALTEDDGSFNTMYLSEIGDYIEDHFAFRSELITANSVLRASLLSTSTDEDVIVGTDNWLYYSATLDDYQHMNTVSERTLFNEAHNIALVQEWAESLGKTFVFTIAPNKNTLYPDSMPSSLNVTYAEESDLERLTDYLLAEGVNYIDMVSLFSSQDEVLYYARDSHWTETGAILAYNALLDAAGVGHETYEGTEPVVTTDYYGDLSEMLYPSGMYPEDYELYLTAPDFEYVTAESSGVSYLEEYRSAGEDEGAVAAAEIADASEIVEQDTVVTYNAGGSGSLYMFRDSFGNSLLPYMAQAFETAVFSEIVPWDLTSEEALDADVIIMEKVERHLPTLSNIAPVMAAVEQNITFIYTSGDVIYGTEEYLLYCLDSLSDEGTAEVITVDDSLLHADTSGMDEEGSEATALSSDAAADTAESESRVSSETSAAGSSSQTSSSGSDGMSSAADLSSSVVTAKAGLSSSVRFGTIEWSETTDGNYIEITGTVSEEICAVGGRIYAAVTDADGTAVYEAFCVSTDESDYGYTLYLPKSGLNGEILNVRLVVRNGSVWTCVAQYRPSSYSASLRSAEDLAQEILDTYGSDDPALAYLSYLAAQEIAEEQEAQSSGESENGVSDSGSDEEDSSGTSTEDASSTIVSKRYIEDCGLDSGYWDITYADGHHEYIDD